MNTAQNQRHTETERRLREAMLFYMEQDREPTVGQLCEHTGINRSTFYRHYVDVYELMNRMEQEFQHGLFRSVQGGHEILSRLSADPDALEPLIAYIGENPHFYRVYLSRSTEVPFDDQFRLYWQEQVKPLFRSYGVQDETHMRYYYEYFKAGLLTVLQLWLEGGCTETPKELSQMISRMLPVRPAAPVGS